MHFIHNATLDFTGKRIDVRLDVHNKSWKVVIYTQRGFFKSFSQDPDPSILAKYLRHTFPGG